MSSKLLQVEDFSLSIRGSDKRLLPVLNNISFSLEQGTCLGIAGESGSGKSVLAMSIAGLLSPSIIAEKKGSILLCGQNLLDTPEKKMQKIRGEQIGFIFQEPISALNPLMTFYEQIAETVVAHKPSLTAKEIYETVCDTSLKAGFEEPEKYFYSYPHQLSGGMCQRAMIAIATVLNPKLVLADEPTTAIDAGLQVRLLKNLRNRLAKSDSSMLFISHDLGVIRAVSDSLAIFYAGRLLEMGKTSEVLSSPSHPYTSDLISALPRLIEERLLPKSIDGTMPSLYDKQEGCIYAKRCKKSKEICFLKEPPKTELSETRYVLCYFPENNN